MPHISLARRTASAVAILAALTIPINADAQVVGPLPTGVVTVPNAPVVVTACNLEHGGPNYVRVDGTVVIANRTTHALASAQVRFVFFDSENARMDQRDILLPLSSPVASGDTATARVDVSFSGTATLLARVSCRIHSANFSANKRWTYGQRWPEKLLPLHTEALSPSGGEGGAAGNMPRSAAAAPRVQIAVTNAWTDTVGGVTYVHDALSITGSDAPTMLRPSNLALTLTLANGSKKAYTGLEQPAPSYAKLNPLGSTPTTAYEVDPAADMGRIGTLTIPPHGTVTTTVTFAIPDPLAAGANYREVAVAR